MEEGYLPSLKKPISAVTQPTVEQKDESLWLGSLMGAEVEFRLNQWFHSANSSEHSTNEQLKRLE
jgi:hypothetical protein